MQRVTFEEYTKAKKEIMDDGACVEYERTDNYGRKYKTILCERGGIFWEVTEGDTTEFWSTKHPDSRKYEERELVMNMGTNVSDVDYQKLAHMCDTNHMTDEEASLFIGQELGFDPLRVKIIHDVEDYYKEGPYFKAWHIYHRDPQYNATDWNYFRFDVCGYSYEYTNGILRFYNN